MPPPGIRPRSIRRQTLLLGAVPLVFLLALLAVALLLAQRIALVASESSGLAQLLYQSNHAAQLLDSAGRSVLAFDRTHNESDLSTYYHAVRGLPRELAWLEATAGPQPQNRAAAARLTEALTNGLAVVSRYLRYSRAGDRAAEARLVNSPRVGALTVEIANARAAFNEEQRLTTARRVNNLTQQIRLLTSALIALSVVGIAVTVLLALRFGVNITKRITRLAENARRLARGEPAEHIPGNDEIAELDKVYREMNDRSRREHDMVMTLQRALLPQYLPIVPGVRLDAAYVPAFGGAEVGGDWYDVFPISQRLLGVSVGDVAGHGLRAATIMGQARQALRTASYIDRDPAAVLDYVNRLLCGSENDAVITAFFATLDLDDGTMRYAMAGHPAPMMVKTGGTVETLPGAGFVLGVEPRVAYESREQQVEIGSAVVFFTDGLVEADRDYVAGLKELGEAIEAEYRNAGGNIAQAIVARMFARRSPRDDVALLFLGITALGASIVRPQQTVWRFNAGNERSARRVKRAALWQLGQRGAGRLDLPAAELVVNELIGNVARHTPGPAELMLEWRDDAAIVRVCDGGMPFKPPAQSEPAELFSEDGRGLFLVRTVVRELRVEWTGEGNCVSAVLPLENSPHPASPRAESRGEANLSYFRKITT